MEEKFYVDKKVSKIALGWYAASFILVIFIIGFVIYENHGSDIKIIHTAKKEVKEYLADKYDFKTKITGVHYWSELIISDESLFGRFKPSFVKINALNKENNTEFDIMVDPYNFKVYDNYEEDIITSDYTNYIEKEYGIVPSKIRLITTEFRDPESPEYTRFYSNRKYSGDNLFELLEKEGHAVIIETVNQDLSKIKKVTQLPYDIIILNYKEDKANLVGRYKYYNLDVDLNLCKRDYSKVLIDGYSCYNNNCSYEKIGD